MSTIYVVSIPGLFFSFIYNILYYTSELIDYRLVNNKQVNTFKVLDTQLELDDAKIDLEK